MECGKLPKPPLVEVIFELRWKLHQKTINSPLIEPHYQLLIGSLYEKIKDQYPFHEQLPTAMMPAEMSAYVIQHRFRKANNKWPLIQLGPGILTLNETKDYTWEDFFSRTKYVVEKFYETHPQNNKLKIKSLNLRYLDVIEFDNNDNVIDFFENKMGITIKMPDSLYDNTNVKNIPSNFDIRLTYPNPKLGKATIRLSKGGKENKDLILWETNIETDINKIPSNQDEIIEWVNESHTLCHQWFQKICEGELMEMFTK